MKECTEINGQMTCRNLRTADVGNHLKQMTEKKWNGMMTKEVCGFEAELWFLYLYY